MASRPIYRPYTGNTQFDDLGRDTSLAVQDIYNAIVPDVRERIMPFDEYTKAFYPCSDPIDNPNSTFADIIGGKNLGIAPGIIHSDEGWVHRGSARAYSSAGGGTTRYAYSNNSGAFGGEITGANQLTVSCWVKMGAMDPVAFGTEKYITNYQEQAGIFNAYTYILCYTQIGGSRMVPRFYLNRAAGIISPMGTEDMQLSPGVWTFLWGTYNGTDATAGMNCTGASSATGVASAINWNPLPNMRKFIGLSATSAFYGEVQDIRVDVVCRPQSWITEAWERGMARFGQDSTYKV